MLDSIPYLLDPAVYARQLAERDLSKAGFLNAWRKGDLPGLSASYIVDVLEAWINA